LGGEVLLSKVLRHGGGLEFGDLMVDLYLLIHCGRLP
jgi:hypothetical protein